MKVVRGGVAPHIRCLPHQAIRVSLSVPLSVYVDALVVYHYVFCVLHHHCRLRVGHAKLRETDNHSQSESGGEGDEEENASSRAWEQGKLLFFDDSFEHDVVNNCDQERVVFQVVFLHPDLWAELLDDDGVTRRDVRQVAGFVPTTTRD